MKVPLTPGGIHTWRSHFTRGSHSPVEVGCAGPVHKLKTHLQVEVLFSRGGPIHIRRSCSHGEDPFTDEVLFTHVEDPFTCRDPIHMLKTCSHMEHPFTSEGPVKRPFHRFILNTIRYRKVGTRYYEVGTR